MDFFRQIDWFLVVKCFAVGGTICVIGQILIDKTKLTSARVLVLFVTIGTILGGFGIYQKLVDFAGTGASIPLTGFGNLLAKGAIKGVQEHGILGAFTGGLTASARSGFLLQYSLVILPPYFQNQKLKSSNFFELLLIFLF